MGPTIGQGWAALVYPDAIGRRWGGVVSGLWLFALLFPIGFWARGRLCVLAPAAAVIILAVVPGITGFRETPILEWGGGLIGLMAGVLIGFSCRSTRFERAP